ncbi:PA14 domain-containing protein [Lentzea kentuckyensis]|uniref:PA14 domain-containing protein n=1 Tax=Lentzea kentuckyensis TaxID=360086 RepID=UPI001B809236|nr:PA14 domain-containing protein [Lentzea kentuckyensis]
MGKRVVVAVVAAVLLSSVEVVLVPSGASAAPIAKNPREVALLKSATGRNEPAAKQVGDFTPLATSKASHFDAKRSKLVSRSMFTEEYENPDGTRTVKQSTAPLNVRDAAGAWQPVDTGLQVDGKSQRAKAKRHPLDPSFAGRANDGAVLSVQVDEHKVALALDQAKPATAKVDGDRVSYADVAPDTDLDYEVESGQVKETIKVKRPGRSSWRFRLDTGGLTPRVENGAVLLADGAGAVKLVIPPVETWDSSGKDGQAPATTGGTYAVERDGNAWSLTVGVDEKWLNDPKRVYPVSVDPTFTYGVKESHTYRSDGYTCDNCGLRIGNSQAKGDTYNRSWFFIDYSPLFGKNVVGARLDVTRDTSTTGSIKTWGAGLYHASDRNINGLGQYLAGALVGDEGSFSSNDFTNFLRTRVNARDLNVAFMMTGTEQAGTWTYKHLNATLVVDTGTAPPAPALVAPADGSVLTGLTPTLSVSPVTDPDGDAVKYCFKIATGSDAQSGVVVDSGCLPTPDWQVPAGVLQDGVAYTWRASAYSGSTMVTPTWVGHVKVDQRIGNHGPSPVDTVGPIAVNLANGNVQTSETTPTFVTVGGNAGLTFSYNSQQRDVKGLRAQYFNDLSHNGIINPGQQPVLVRTEPQVNVSWGTDSPFAPALGADWFVVRWEGFFQAPFTAKYKFAGLHDDGAEVFINNTKIYDGDGASDVNWAAGTEVALTAGQRVPIKVELQEITSGSQMRLFVRTTDAEAVPPQIVPADWLFSSDLPALPQGWTLSADLDGSGVNYTTAQVTDQNVVLTDASGGKHTWTKKSSGGYTAPEGEDGVLSLDTAGLVTLNEGGTIFTFRADGKLDTQYSVADSRKPATLQNVYDGGTPARLTQIKDPVSGRAHVLHYNRSGDDCYGGATPPSGADPAPPAQMLCRVSYWDGTETRIWYNGGHLSRIEDPGSQVTDYGYTGDLLDQVRPSLINDWIAADPAGRAGLTDIAAKIEYDQSTGKAKATKVTAPAAAPGKPRATHTYGYDPANRQTSIAAAGHAQPSRVTYDDADRLLTSTDGTGRTTRQSWNAKDKMLSSTDSAGRMSTTEYDYADRPVGQYGPAPASCFAGQIPTGACWDKVPATTTKYDEGMKGLSASFYDNTTLAGVPKVVMTGVGTADGTLAANWGWERGHPPNMPNDVFSARFTGEIVFPAGGEYTLRAFVDDGIRMWIDDALVIDDWKHVDTATWREAKTTSPTVGAVKRIRIDYLNDVGYSRIELHWTTPFGTQEIVPGHLLRPRYGLATTTTGAESAGVPDKVGAVRYDGGLDPVYGLATSNVADPNGQALAQSTGYEAPGSGYLRVTTKSQPTGAQTTNTYYGDNETRANPCVPGSPAVNQAGALKQTTSARTDEQIYDASGRVVAKAVAGDWQCTEYDARDRVVKQTFPASSTDGARTVNHTYGVNGDPLTSTTADHNGTVTASVDLLGRTVRHTDVHGTKTVIEYDQNGRVVSTTTTPPNPADSPIVSSFTYDDADRLLTTKVGTTVLATSTYDAAGELASVDYANGSKLSAIGKDEAGRATSLTWLTSDGKQVVSAVTRTKRGTIVDESLGGADPNPNGANYVYDATGRMTQAWVPGHHYTYDFTSSAPSGCPSGTVGNAGLNTNRVRLQDETAAGPVLTGYCYDAQDRLLATTGTNPMTGFTYDKQGNTTQFTAGATTTYLDFDGAGRNTKARNTGTDPASVAYLRDATNRIVRRDTTQGDTIASVLYSYTAAGDSSDLALDANKKLLSTTISLPGGVLYTAAAQMTWDHPSVRGDLVLTTDAGGKQSGGLRSYAPFGEPLNDVPDNQPGKMDYGWLGQHQRPYEHAGSLALVQMGARPYSPVLGRFLAMDPVEGGSANDYDYVGANPVNDTDLDGQWSLKWRWRVPSIRNVGRRLFYAARFARNLPFTALSVGWAKLWGGRCSRAPGLMIHCTRMRWGYGTRGGVTIGNTYLTPSARVSGPVARHESVHATQWGIFGLHFPVYYGITEIFQPGGLNFWERQAGQCAGGYCELKKHRWARI